MQIASIAIIAAFWAGAGLAQEWTPMSGEEITATLTDQTLIYDIGQQKFFASGRTLYSVGEDSWGTWAVRDDQYCSQWPPSGRWDCYDMTRAGQAVQFVDRSGNVTEGALAQ